MASVHRLDEGELSGPLYGDKELELSLAVWRGDAGAILRSETDCEAGVQEIAQGRGYSDGALAVGRFRCDPSDSSVVFPIMLDQEKLAKAFEEDDFEAALRPIADAFRAAIAARADFDALMTAIRKDAEVS
jgi:hypothetical protein